MIEIGPNLKEAIMYISVAFAVAVFAWSMMKR